VDSTYKLAETLLAADRELAAGLPEDKIYVTDSAGHFVTNQFGDLVHRPEYARKYHERLHGMIESQLRKAIAETANFWYTAWVNAGKPKLSGLDPGELTERNQEHLQRDLRRWRGGKVDMFRPDKEFK
ncbi:MAG TPA: hypothetical protein VE035_06365, partial [Puia sp.]|nr:hypothetical protein [Puia sp.]